ncbi:MAG: MltA domain-containing protein [SAR324 cluster bacterium]|nr:MltA domain-containing protein [SAR324 cluster bacterium]
MKLVNRPFGEFLVGDDLPVEGLRQAIQQSLIYLDRIPQNQTVAYGNLIYTASEVSNSMKLFLALLDRLKNAQDLVAELEKNFLIFESTANEGDQVMLTGYYEPVFEGSVQRSQLYNIPVYGIPRDLQVLQLKRFRKSLKYRTIVYRTHNSELVPYHSREEIMEQNILAEKAEVLAWMKDPVDLFFLQIQGSGMLVLPSGQRVKLSYAGSNGLPYSSIGKLLVEEEKLVLEEVSMAKIREYLNTHPDELKRILYHNNSYTFFNLEEKDEQPRGSLNVPLTPHRSIAMDVTVFPKASLGYLVSDVPDFTKDFVYKGQRHFARFVVSQDTGGAIKGPGRVDLFWGNGRLAEKSAGSMRSFGKLYFVIAKKEVLSQVTSFPLKD